MFNDKNHFFKSVQMCYAVGILQHQAAVVGSANHGGHKALAVGFERVQSLATVQTVHVRLVYALVFDGALQFVEESRQQLVAIGVAACQLFDRYGVGCICCGSTPLFRATAAKGISV